MERALKTKDVARVLGVSSRTIQRWVRHYNVPYHTNEKGHFQFTEQHVKMLEKIRDQINQTAAISPADQSEGNTPARNGRAQQPDHAQRITQPAPPNKLEERLTDLETMLSNKADQVVYEQVLGHRRELDHLNSRLDDLETKLSSLEAQMDEIKTQLETTANQKRPRFFSRFSLART